MVNFEKESEMRDRLLKDAKAIGIHLIDMRQGTFDLLLDAPVPRLIELKMVGENPHWVNVADHYGFKFGRAKTEEMGEMRNKALIPFVIGCDNIWPDERRFYFITGESLKSAMDMKRRKYEKMIFNRHRENHLFREHVTWEEVLERLRKLAGIT